MATLTQTIEAGSDKDGKLFVEASALDEVRNVCSMDEEGEFVVDSTKVVPESEKIGYKAEETEGGYLFTKT